MSKQTNGMMLARLGMMAVLSAATTAALAVAQRLVLPGSAIRAIPLPRAPHGACRQASIWSDWEGPGCPNVTVSGYRALVQDWLRPHAGNAPGVALWSFGLGVAVLLCCVLVLTVLWVDEEEAGRTTVQVAAACLLGQLLCAICAVALVAGGGR